jgi:hypothetical protein
MANIHYIGTIGLKPLKVWPLTSCITYLRLCLTCLCPYIIIRSSTKRRHQVTNSPFTFLSIISIKQVPKYNYSIIQYQTSDRENPIKYKVVSTYIHVSLLYLAMDPNHIITLNCNILRESDERLNYPFLDVRWPQCQYAKANACTCTISQWLWICPLHSTF